MLAKSEQRYLDCILLNLNALTNLLRSDEQALLANLEREKQNARQIQKQVKEQLEKFRDSFTLSLNVTQQPQPHPQPEVFHLRKLSLFGYQAYNCEVNFEWPTMAQLTAGVSLKQIELKSYLDCIGSVRCTLSDGT